VETISGSLGIDLALELVVTQEEELLKYTGNPLEDYMLLQKLKSRRNCCFIDADTHSTEIMLKNGVDIENLILNQIMESRH
jgi:hypothetical protein